MSRPEKPAKPGRAKTPQPGSAKTPQPGSAKTPQPGNAKTPQADAAPQFRRTRRGSDNNGVASAKPRVITGSDDATIHKYPPGTKPKKDWSIGFDETQPASDKEDGNREGPKP